MFIGINCIVPTALKYKALFNPRIQVLYDSSNIEIFILNNKINVNSGTAFHLYIYSIYHSIYPNQNDFIYSG
jgi:hypothetical protein